MRRGAFLTLADPGDFVIDDEHAYEPLRELGWSVDRRSTCGWTQRLR